MSVTSEASIPSRDHEVSDESRASELDLDSLVLLKRRGKPSLKNSISASRIRGWLESSPEEGERWLRGRAQEGDLYAMEKLGWRLLTGDGLSRSIGEGVTWLTKSAEMGNPFAMERLADYRFEEAASANVSAEGERWLNAATEHGCRLAMVNLASRLMTGVGLARDTKRGERLLRQAAQQGSQTAMIELGTYLLSSWHERGHPKEGLSWLRRAGATNANELLELGMNLYHRSLTASTTVRRWAATEAAILFREALRQGNRVASLNLAYLLRRGEITNASCPSLDELLMEHLKTNNSFALVNQALRLAKGVDCSVDWNAADNLFRRLQDSANILEWWFARSQEGDPEGHLVTAWLARHELAMDPEGRQIASRMDLVRRGGWQVPEWMNDPQAAGKH